MAKGILISYAGYPYTPSSLLPDNGLANLAGSLLKNGHKVVILDYGTLSMMKKLVDDPLHRQLENIYSRFLSLKNNRTLKGKWQALTTFLQLKRADKKLAKRQSKAVSDLADNVSTLIKKYNPDFVGFKLWNGDGFTGSIQIAQRLKKDYPSLPIFAGGPQVDFFKEHIFKAASTFEILVYGEGEKTIGDLAEYVEGRKNLRDIPNIIYKEGGKIITNPIKRIENLNELPFPVYDEDIYPAMKDKIKMVVLDDSRGCPHKCHFCIQPIKSGFLRLKSADRIVEEMRYIKERYGISLFRYAGSATPGKLMREVAEKIIEENLGVQYTSFAHVQGATPEGFRLMKESGLYSLFFGIESGSQKILDEAFDKKITLEQIRQVIKMAQDADIFTVGSMIIPAPFDTEQTIKESLSFLKQIRPDSVPVQFAGLYPQTEWANQPEKFNFTVNKNNYLEKIMNYKIKLFFPPQFWEKLPYKINGKSHKEFASQTMQFIQQLEEAGILTGVTDELALIADVAGMEIKEFRDKMRRWFFTGDYERISAVVEKINQRAVKDETCPLNQEVPVFTNIF